MLVCMLLLVSHSCFFGARLRPNSSQLFFIAQLACERSMAPKSSAQKDELLALMNGDVATSSKTNTGVLKRPASVLGKPAANTGKPAASTAASLVEAEEDKDDKQGAEDTRDRLKAIAFNNMKDELPQWAKDMWEDKNQGPGKRRKATAMINSLMVRLPGGKYSFNLDAPIFTEYRTRWEEKFAKGQTRALPRSLAVAACGGEPQFVKALENGEISEVREQEGGPVFYAWREIKTGQKTAATVATTVQKSVAIDNDTYRKISDKLESMGWSLNLSKAQFTKISDSTVIPPIAYEKMQTALNGTEKAMPSYTLP